MAKLVEILAREFTQWPTESGYLIAQDDNGRVYGWSDIPKRGYDQWLVGSGYKLSGWRHGDPIDLAEDCATAIVTRAEWQAAVDALNQRELDEVLKRNEQLAAKVLERKARNWDGVGLPPVGTVCEYSVNGGPWYPCEIRYQYSGSECQFSIIYCPHLLYEQQVRHKSTGDCDGTTFRPIRTPEQIAAEERGKALDLMGAQIEVLLGDISKHLPSALLGAIYDLGYRMQEPK